MKTSPAETIRAPDGNEEPIMRSSRHVAGHALAETPAPRAAGTGATDTGGMSMSEAVAVLTDTAIRSALHAGARPRRTARLIMIAVQGACRDCGIDAQERTRLIARIMVRVTSRLGGNVAAVTTGLVQGAIDCAPSAGIPAETALAAAADGALQAADDEDWSAAGSVYRVVTLLTGSRCHVGGNAPPGPHPVASTTQAQ